jgi:trypsin
MNCIVKIVWNSKCVSCLVLTLFTIITLVIWIRPFCDTMVSHYIHTTTTIMTSTNEYQFIRVQSNILPAQHQREVLVYDDTRLGQKSSMELEQQNERRMTMVSSNNQYSNGQKPGLRIVGGDTVTDPDIYPYFAFPAGDELCGATLIYTDILLTAAHCLGAFISYGALIGGTKLDSSESQFVTVDYEYPHPNYTRGTVENDIMLVRLSAYITTPTVVLNFNNSIPDDDEITTVIGFGLTSENGTFSHQLLAATVNVVPFDQCNAYFGDLNNETIICAGTDDGSRDSCRGDSGGPLLKSTLTTNVQVGIVSYGDGCAKPGLAAVYTRISAYTEWIQQGICDLSYNPPKDCTFTPTTSPPTSSPIPTLDDTIPSRIFTVQPTAVPTTAVPTTAVPTTTIISSVSPTASPGPNTNVPQPVIENIDDDDVVVVVVQPTLPPIPEEKSPRSQPTARVIHPTSSSSLSSLGSSTGSMTPSRPSKPQNNNNKNIVRERNKKSRKKLSRGKGGGSMKREKIRKSSRDNVDDDIEYNDNDDDDYDDDDDKSRARKPHYNDDNSYEKSKSSKLHRQSHDNKSGKMEKVIQRKKELNIKLVTTNSNDTSTVQLVARTTIITPATALVATITTNNTSTTTTAATKPNGNATAHLINTGDGDGQ